jgi:hypothetical protein
MGKPLLCSEAAVGKQVCDTGPALRQAAWEKNISSLAEASARNELLLRRGSSRGRAPKNACVGGTSVNTFFFGEQAAITAAALWKRCHIVSLWAVDVGVGYNSWLLGPSTHATTLCPS